MYSTEKPDSFRGLSAKGRRDLKVCRPTAIGSKVVLNNFHHLKHYQKYEFFCTSHRGEVPAWASESPAGTFPAFNHQADYAHQYAFCGAYYGNYPNVAGNTWSWPEHRYFRT